MVDSVFGTKPSSYVPRNKDVDQAIQDGDLYRYNGKPLFYTTMVHAEADILCGKLGGEAVIGVTREYVVRGYYTICDKILSSHNVERIVPSDLLCRMREELSKKKDQGVPKKRFYPENICCFDDFDALIDDSLLQFQKKEPLIGNDSLIVCQGSCFAEHLAKALVARNRCSDWIPVRETINTTFHLKKLTQWAYYNSNCAEIDKLLAGVSEQQKEKTRNFFQKGDVFIFTIGLSVGLVKSKSYDGSLPEQVRYGVFPTEINAGNILSIIEMVRKHRPNSHIFLTLSPVPLVKARPPYSPVAADCLSKSAGRLAIQAVLDRNIPNVRYWPSYEIVRWLAPMLPVPLFGIDDGSARHVPKELVDFIMRKFLEHYAVAP